MIIKVLMDQVRKTCHHSATPSRVHLAQPVGAGSSPAEAAVPMVVLAQPGPVVPVVPLLSWVVGSHLMARTTTMTRLASGRTEEAGTGTDQGNAACHSCSAGRVLVAAAYPGKGGCACGWSWGGAGPSCAGAGASFGGGCMQGCV
jgi:hypothetical protein